MMIDRQTDSIYFVHRMSVKKSSGSISKSSLTFHHPGEIDHMHEFHVQQGVGNKINMKTDDNIL